MHDVLKNFLEMNLPEKKKKIELGVSDEKLGASINEALGVSCAKSKLVLELLRGIRVHFAKFIKELKDGDYEKAQLGLGHSYSRSKVKFNVNRSDNMIIQSISLLDTLDKDLNTFAMRVKYRHLSKFGALAILLKSMSLCQFVLLQLIESGTHGISLSWSSLCPTTTSLQG